MPRVGKSRIIKGHTGIDRGVEAGLSGDGEQPGGFHYAGEILWYNDWLRSRSDPDAAAVCEGRWRFVAGKDIITARLMIKKE